MNRDELLALADRVEALTYVDRKVDCAIEVAIAGFPEKQYQARNALRSKGTSPLDRMGWLETWGVLAFTASLDAAMTLVPEGAVWNAGNDAGNWAHVWHDIKDYGGVPFSGRGATPAVALAAAALRALAAQGGKSS